MSDPDFGKGDFRMNMLCHSLIQEIKMDVGSIGPCLRPEVAQAFAGVLTSIADLDKVTTRFLEENNYKLL